MEFTLSIECGSLSQTALSTAADPSSDPLHLMSARLYVCLSPAFDKFSLRSMKYKKA